MPKPSNVLIIKTSILYPKDYSKIVKPSEISPLSTSVFKVEFKINSQTTEVLQTTSKEHTEIYLSAIAAILQIMGIHTDFPRDVLPTVIEISLPKEKIQQTIAIKQKD